MIATASLVDPLGIVCEVSIGLAGFTGIVAIFADARHSVSAAVRFRIVNLLVSAFSPGFFALLVISLLELGVPGEPAARSGNALFALGILVWAALATRTRAGLPAGERRQLSTSIYWFNAVVAIGNALAQLLSALGVLGNPSGVLVAGLCAMLFLGAITFAALVMQVLGRERSDVQASAPGDTARPDRRPGS